MHSLMDSAAVAISELVTNALRHGMRGLPPARTSRPTHSSLFGQPILLGLARQGGTLLCAVFDPGDQVPRVGEPGEYAESGRGLQVVESLSEAWGWTTPDHSGKAVWAMFRTSPGSAAPPLHPADRAAVPAYPEGSGPGGPESEWDPLTRLLLLMEIIGDPPWLQNLQPSARKSCGPECGRVPGQEKRALRQERSRRGDS